ncbi:MAG: bifunctional heptose 7-phosphate kinase/heptose 1-phosphate adenyltransferase, partial [Planctomycetota bacterium]
LGCVDHVLVFDDPTPHALLRAIRPDVLVKGGDYRVEQVVGREIVWEYGGQVRVVANVSGVSTTTILRQLAVGGASGEIGAPRPQPTGANE